MNKFYCFKQNNSGGSFAHEPENGIGYTVWVEAVDAAHANARAELIGLYFDGCRGGRDCNCCGDRWSEVYRDDGDTVPKLYGETWRPAADNEQPTLEWRIPSYIHRLDGSFKPAVRI